MKVRSGVLHEGRTIDVELEDQDGELAFGREWDEMALFDRFKRLSAKADSLVVYYMAAENMISKARAESRLAAIRRRE